MRVREEEVELREVEVKRTKWMRSRKAGEVLKEYKYYIMKNRNRAKLLFSGDFLTIL